MNGKKFIAYFIGATVVVGTLFSVAMKRSYDTRPKTPFDPKNPAAYVPVAPVAPTEASPVETK